MSVWYKTGTITVTNGLTTVTGSGTAWIANAQIGEALYAPDGRLYEIVAIVSDTALTIAPAYLGSTQSGQAYTIVPSQGYIRSLAAQAADLVNNYSTIANFAGQGKFGDGTVTNPGIRFSDDLDTGIYRIGTNILGISAGGGERFRATSTGIQATGTFTATGNTTLANLSYTGTLTGGTGVVNIGSGQIYKDASGNVGIGTSSPSAPLHVVGAITGSSTIAIGGVPATGGTVRIPNGGSIAFRNAANSANLIGLSLDSSNNLSLREGNVVITSAGNVGIGTSSPASTLTVNGDIQVLSTNYLNFSNTAQQTYIRGPSTNTLAFGTNSAERARIESSGNLLVGTTSVNGAQGLTIRPNNSVGSCTLSLNRASNASASTAFLLLTGGSTVGSITYSNTATAYNTSSDYRLKEDIQPVLNPIDRLMQLKPINFAWKVDGTRVDGFLAHEAQEVVPEAVTGAKDAVDADGNPEYQGIDQSKLVPLLTAALQELSAKVDALESQLNSGA
jgi:hypothetical protein